ncbi:MAG: insulinase family protein [Clostridia bacterium]|nr:insulinase family protein [Clostridia bacterium]
MSEEMKLFKSELLGEQYYEFRHKSGLPIYVFPKKMSVTHVLLAVNYGSANNYAKKGVKPPFPDGIAHFLEHKLFSNEDGSDSFERFSALGADANAYTSHTRTVYLFSATDRLQESLAELIDFVTHPYFTAESVKKEQGIIAEEIRMCRDNPYDRCYYNMLEGLYAEHPVKVEICGSIRSIGQITDQVLYDCYHTYYRLPNMALVVCGDMTPEEVMAVADAHLPTELQGFEPPKMAIGEPAAVHRARVTARGQVAKPIFSIGIKDADIPADPLARAKRDAQMGILAEMLFSPSGELYNRLYESGLISPEFSADFSLTRDFGFMQIAGEAEDPDTVLKEIQHYLIEVRQKGLSKADFERARRVEFAEYIKSFDSTEEISNSLVAFVFDDASLFDHADILQNMRFEDIKELFETFFDPSRFTLSVVEPQKQSKKKEG